MNNLGVTIDEIISSIHGFKFDHSEGQIEVNKDVWLDYDFIIDDIKYVKGGSVNTGFGEQDELLKDITYDVDFKLWVNQDEISLSKKWEQELEFNLINAYE